jgi:hypothetical protein
MSNGFIYVVDAHFIDKIEENKYPGPKCLWYICILDPSACGIYVSWTQVPVIYMLRIIDFASY